VVSVLLKRAMFALVGRILLTLCTGFESRAAREADILVRRQQLLVLSRRSRKRVSWRSIDRPILPLSPSSRRSYYAGIDEASAPTGVGSLGVVGEGPEPLAKFMD
jgi:hypothetical protein